MDVIHNNPFRVLGLAVDSSERDIAKRISDLETATEFGKKVSYATDFPFLSTIERTSESVRLAANRIETAESRFFYSLFWFWQQNSGDELALDVLKDGNIDKAIKLLEGQFKDVTQKEALYSNAKNLYVLYLAIARENGRYNFDRFSQGLLWAGKVLDTNMLTAYAKRIAGQNFVFEKQKIIGSFVDEIVKTVTPHIDKPDGIALPQLISKFSSFPEENRRIVSARFIGTHIKKIEDAVQRTEQLRQNSPDKADKTGDELYKSTASDLKKISEVLSTDDFQYQAIADKLAEEIADCSVAYYNYHLNNDSSVDPGDNALRLARCAYSIAVGIKIKQRLNEGIPIIEKWVNGKAERDKTQRIKADYDYIIDQLSDVPDCDELSETQANLLPEMAGRLVKNCKPRLENIRSTLGTNDDTYLDLSSAVASNAMGMCVYFANEIGEFTRITGVFDLIGTLAMNSDVKSRYDSNYRVYKKQAVIKDDLDVIIAELKKVPDADKPTYKVDQRFPQPPAVALFEFCVKFLKTCKPRLASIKNEDRKLYLELSSAVASNALGMIIDYVNKTHDTKIALSVMQDIGEFDMEQSLKERYNKNFQIMMSNLAASSKPAASGGCYIATMVYGSYDAPEVLLLRNFRDAVLSKWSLGRVFIKYYYRFSPYFVKRFQNSKTIHAIAKRLLDSIIRRLM